MINKNLFVPLILGAALLVYAFSAGLIIKYASCCDVKNALSFAKQYCQIMNTTIGGLFLGALGIDRIKGLKGSSLETAGNLFSPYDANEKYKKKIGFVAYSIYVFIGFAFIIKAFLITEGQCEKNLANQYQFITDIANSFVGIIVSILVANLAIKKQ